MVIEIARSVRSDYEALLIVSGHGGNAPALRPAVDQLRREGHSVELAEPRWEPATAWPPGVPDRLDAHAGFVETSLMLFLRPDLVRPFESVAGNASPITELLPTLVSRGVGAVSDTGVLGDPSGASREIGELLFNHLVDGMVAGLERLRRHTTT
jgi:creatinine amidohydrolase